MAEWDETTEQVAIDDEPRHRWPDPLNLIAGLITLGVAAYAVTDGRVALHGVDPKWIIAAGALLVGVLMLGASLRPGRRR
ncbi:MAG TPA: hypothetical protein VFX16_24810 [Pseudonocardiaceae bacterium]|nr:hypothetical protein [Pseudonocardiaceae bacterium]